MIEVISPQKLWLYYHRTIVVYVSVSSILDDNERFFGQVSDILRENEHRKKNRFDTSGKNRRVSHGSIVPHPQQRTIFGESIPFVALRVSTTNCDCSTIALKS